MGKVIKFSNKYIERQSEKMLRVAGEIDSVILKHLDSGMDPKDMAGLIAHRLGTLMSHIEETDRKTLLGICEKVMKDRANLDDAFDF